MGSEVPKKTLDLENLLNAFELFVAREFDVFMEDPTIIRLDGNYKVIIENKDDKPDHNWVHVHDAKATLLVGERGPLGLYCYSKNKEYKKSEEDLIQLESISAMRELAATYAHEIKNPLFSIRGFIQLLQKSFGEDDKRREYTDIAIKELDRIQRIIMEFLALSRDISSEKNNDEAHNTVQQVIKDALKLFQNAFKIKNINCQCNLSEEILQVPISDDHFKQICINLIQNSIDSMELGKSIYIDVKSDDNKVYISLQDEGKGIPEENLEKIFSPFFSTKEKGTGLGLYITKQIIEGCGGTIKVDSIYGEGTTFLLELPRERN